MAPTTSSSSSNGQRDPSTSRRDRDRDRHPSSQHSAGPIKLSSSSTSSVHTHSTSTSSVSAPSSTTLTPIITVDVLLKQNASSPNPTAAALDQVVIERNTLSSQNAQLWKLIEKQRKGYNDILKELERIRGERDLLRNRLHSIGASTDKSLSRGDRTPKAGAFEPSQAANSSGHLNGTSRQNSQDEYAGGRTSSSLHSSRSHEPLASRSSDNSLQSNAANTPSTPVRSHSPALPPPSSAPSLMMSSNPTRTQQRPPQPPSLVPSHRQDSHVESPVSTALDSPVRRVQANVGLPGVASGGGANGVVNGPRDPLRKPSLADQVSAPANGPLNSSQLAYSGSQAPLNYQASSRVPAPQSSQKGDDHSEQTPSPLSRPHPTDSRPPNSASIQPNIAPRVTPTIITTNAGLSHPQQPSLTSPQSQLLSATTPVTRSPYLSRDSRISLPDEARQYIANMADSPIASPRTNDFSTASSVATPPTTMKTSTSREVFLELEEEEDDEYDATPEEVPASEGEESEPPQSREPTTPTNSNFSRGADDATLTNRQNKRRVPPEENPYPPSSNISLQRQQGPSAQEGQSLASQQSPQGLAPPSKPSNSTDQLPSNMTHQSQESLNSARGYNNSQPSGHPIPHTNLRMPGPATPSAQALSAAFRALPLLPTDLPRTTIVVSHSFVRPNDRGKEVLSFVVSVNPGNGKPGWKVEKMYSDVLSLDQRVRSSVGKGVGKKIANLPEGKLWKDHAPARVDQRKAVLEQYLQSLIHLPIKSNDEVIAFFTSDIVREAKQPVMQVGHKEGYLTKRGKNFGGWKTRFFVLQGPILEYYDCRGGQHLGSILITGAQIARQHRTDKTSSTDEEKEYRHAFLIVEAKKGPGGNHPRHVLCAESDEERDAWVELLVRYYTGTYNEELHFSSSSGLNTANSNSIVTSQHSHSPSQARSSTSSSEIPYATPSRKPPPVRPPLTTDDFTRSSSPARSIDPSPIERPPTSAPFRNADRGLPSSLPDSSPLSSVPTIRSDNGPIERANSELGHYPDLQEQQTPRSAQPRHPSPERHRPRDVYEGRHKNYSSSNLPTTSQDRAPTPDRDANAKVKISRPMNGAPIPSGFKFGGGGNAGKDPSSDTNAAAERREKAKSRSFWGFGKAGGGERAPATMAPRAVFGVPLLESLDVAEICGLPAIVFRSIQYLEAKKADQEEGIYRLNGSSAVIKALKDRFNTEGDVDLLAIEEYLDPHAVAGLLKGFLRDLPDSILTRELHLRFLSVIDLTDAQERIKDLSQLIAALPISNYTLLRALTAHLILIVQNAHVNKMTMRNVGIVFSPTLGIPAGVFSLMLGEFNRVFNVDNDDDDPAAGDDASKHSDEESDRYRRNSRQYTDNAADQLLGLTGRSLQSGSPDDTQSEGDDLSVHDESGTEDTEGERTFDSSSSSSPVQDSSQHDHSVHISPPETPIASKASKASTVAASKGLNLTVTGSERGNRHSRLMGLPTSPRPTPPHSKSAHDSLTP